MQNSFKKLIGGGLTRTIIISLLATLACVGIIKAATTVGNNITTGGTLDVSGASTLTGNTSVSGALTSFGANTFYGATSIGGALTATSTLSVSGLTTLGNASTTLLSVSGTQYVGGANGLILADGSITDASGSISFGNENLTTSGSLTANYFTADSATATSTFAGDLSISGDGIIDGQLDLRDSDVVGPGWNIVSSLNTYGAFQIEHSSNYGGLTVWGISESTTNPLELRGAWGVTDPLDAAATIRLEAWKYDGDVHVAGVGSEETILEINSGHNRKVVIEGDGSIGINLDSESTGNQVSNMGGPVFEIKSGAMAMRGNTTVQHGITDIMPTAVFWYQGINNGPRGGLASWAISENTFPAYQINGILGTATPGNTLAAIELRGYKSNGLTGIASLGNAETILQIKNGDTAKVSVLGDGSLGIGTTTPSSLFTVNAGSSATTTVEFGDQYSASSKTCFNAKNTAGGNISFYFVGTTMAVENNRCQ